MTAGVLGYAQRACKQAGGSDAKHHFENILTVLAEGGLTGNTNRQRKHVCNMPSFLLWLLLLILRSCASMVLLDLCFDRSDCPTVMTVLGVFMVLHSTANLE